MEKLTPEATRKFVVDFPASVMDQLQDLKIERGETVKALVLAALEKVYGIRPKGDA